MVKNRNKGRNQKGGRGRNNQRRNQQGKDLYRMSRSLTHVLRHEARKLGLQVSGAGFVKVSDLARLNRFRGLTAADVKKIAADDNKDRFKWEIQDGEMVVRANQGHTFQLVEDEIFTRIQRPEELNACIHGTYNTHLNSIMKSGLCRMQRTHIHFTPSPVVTQEARSGFRGTCDILIHLDVRKALMGGLKLFRSDNNVILCPGNETGYIPSEFFAKVEDRWTGKILFTNQNLSSSTAKPQTQPEPELVPVNTTDRPTRAFSNHGTPPLAASTPPARNNRWAPPNSPEPPEVLQRPPQSQSLEDIQQAERQQNSKPMSYADHARKH